MGSAGAQGARFGAALAAAALLAALPARAAPEGLRVLASPDSVLLGTDEVAELTVEGPADMGAPTLTVNVGAIEALRELSPGRWSARLRPPPKRHPQVAIVSAVAGARQGWRAVPLFGQGEAAIRTKPGGRIEAVRIGEREFGPAVADAKGTALVPVVVPPGVTQAFHGAQAIDLGLPPAVHLHLALDRAVAAADREQAIGVWIYAVDAHGRPRPGAPVELSAAAGRLGPTAPVAPGVQRATWTLPPGKQGPVTLTARLADEPGLSRAATLTRVAGRPATLTLELDRGRFVAGQGFLLARAFAADAAGNPAVAQFRLEASFGAAQPPREVGPGRWEARIEVPAALAGHTRLEVRAVSPAGEALARASLPLEADDPLLALTPPRAALSADGESALELRLRARDRFGNPAGGEPRVSAGQGATAVRAVEPGEWAIDYRPPRRFEESEDTVTAELAGAAAHGAISLLPGARTLELAPKIGVLSNGSLGGAWLAAEAGYRFTLRGQPFAALLEAGWHRFDADEDLDAGRLDARHDFLSVLAALAWRRPFGVTGKWVFSASLGLGISQLWSTLQLAGQPAQDDRGLAFAYGASFGVQRRMWRGGPFLELRYARTTDYGAPNLKGQLGTLLLDLGYRYEAL